MRRSSIDERRDDVTPEWIARSAKIISQLRNEVEDDDFDDVLYECEPILLLIAIDLKEEIIYASVDLGNGVVEDIAREKLADNEEDFRKQIQRMINAF